MTEMGFLKGKHSNFLGYYDLSKLDPFITSIIEAYIWMELDGSLMWQSYYTWR
jgi:hypothetical protein